MAKGHSINTPSADATSLRGIGKLDYSNRSRLNSTIKKLTASMETDEVPPMPAKKEKVKCPGCGRNFRTNKGKIPQHIPQRWSSGYTTNEGYCTQSRSPWHQPVIKEVIESTIINEIEIKKGDTIAFIPYPWSYPNHPQDVLKEYKVKNVFLGDNNIPYIDLGIELEPINSIVKGKKEPHYISTNRFTKNFIKL